MILDPKLIYKEDEKYEEIAKFGKIVDALLKLCSDDLETPSTSSTTKI